MPSNFKKYLIISFSLHLLVFLFLMYSDAFDFEMEPTKVTYVRLSFGDGGKNTRANLRKLKGLPSSTIRDQREALKKLAKLKNKPKELTDKPPPLESKLADKTAQPPVDKKKIIIGGGKNKKPPKKKLSRAEQALAKIDNQLKKRTEQAKMIEIGSAQAKNEETGQSAWGGERGNVIDPQLIAYYNKIKRKISNEWLVSKSKFSGALVAKINVLIDGNGHVIRTNFAKKSGDGSFDDSAIRAIRKGSPFPVPPPSIRQEAVKEGFTFVFNPRTVSGSVR